LSCFGYRKSGRRTTIDYRHEKGGAGAIPLAWTDADQADPFLNVSQGRSVFRVAELRSSGTLNRNPQRVSDPLFSGHAFFDAQDLVQIKYEMLRRPLTDSVHRREQGFQSHPMDCLTVSRNAFKQKMGSMHRFNPFVCFVPTKRSYCTVHVYPFFFIPLITLSFSQ
jgi:hypothetical protein